MRFFEVFDDILAGIRLAVDYVRHIKIGINVPIGENHPPVPCPAPPMTWAEVHEALALAVDLAGEPLDPEHSVVDLMKALRRDSSIERRRGLWADFGGIPIDYKGTAPQNEELIAKTLQQIKDRCVL